jgi:excisionase family DNA binding protein
MNDSRSSWLELQAAADYIGVHFSSLRRWTDDGKVRCIRTPGGHRRYHKADLDAFLRGLRKGPDTGALMMQEFSQPMQLVSSGHASLRREAWFGELDESERMNMRSGGKQLIAVLMQYATRSQGGEPFMEEGKRLAAEYGQVCHAAGLSLADTIRAFITVRRSITNSVRHAGALANASDPEALRLYDRLDGILDAMLLAMLDSFDRARQQRLNPHQMG